MMKFEDYYNKQKVEFNFDKDRFDEIKDKWKEFRKKIIDETLTAEEYNGKNEFFDDSCNDAFSEICCIIKEYSNKTKL